VKFLPLLLALIFVSCAPAYSTSKTNSGDPSVVNGVYIGVFAGGGDLDAKVIAELTRAFASAGFKVTGLKYPDPRGATIKVEGDLTLAQSSEPRPSKFSKAEIRVIDFRSSAVAAKYRFETGNPLEARGAPELARDIAGLLVKDFRQAP
jgi:hypothetical protein